MTREQEILNVLLDRYERSGHCLPGKTSNRRIALSLGRGEYAPYRENDPQAEEINYVVQTLAEKKLVSFSWRKGYEGWLLDKVYLELETLPHAYKLAGRTPLTHSAETFLDMVQQAMKSLHTPWKLRFLEDEAERIQKKLRPSRLLPENQAQAEALLAVLQYTERGPELMRVISTNCFHDSKFLEKNLLPSLVSIAKAYEPDLVTYRALDQDILTQSVILKQIGILTYPEIFEFCGDVCLKFTDTTVETAPFQNGFCLQSENLEQITEFGLGRLQTILFVENRTNYRRLVLNGIPGKTLIVHHGGFYSPAKRELFRLIAGNVLPSAKVFFWGDLDRGGFLMFTRLKKELFPTLAPYKMGIDEYEAYQAYGIERTPGYLRTLQQQMEAHQFDVTFAPVAQAILRNGVTVEQEIML